MAPRLVARQFKIHVVTQDQSGMEESAKGRDDKLQLLVGLDTERLAAWRIRLVRRLRRFSLLFVKNVTAEKRLLRVLRHRTSCSTVNYVERLQVTLWWYRFGNTNVASRSQPAILVF